MSKLHIMAGSKGGGGVTGLLSFFILSKRDVSAHEVELSALRLSIQ